jgi:hypothetical protein
MPVGRRASSRHWWHVRSSLQERVLLILSSDGEPPPATEAAYMDQSMRRAWASESAAAELLNRDGFSSCRLCLFARQAANARCRSDSCSVKSTSSPFGPGRKNSSNLAPRARRARAATSCFRIVPR